GYINHNWWQLTRNHILRLRGYDRLLRLWLLSLGRFRFFELLLEQSQRHHRLAAAGNGGQRPLGHPDSGLDIALMPECRAGFNKAAVCLLHLAFTRQQLTEVHLGSRVFGIKLDNLVQNASGADRRSVPQTILSNAQIVLYRILNSLGLDVE